MGINRSIVVITAGLLLVGGLVFFTTDNKTGPARPEPSPDIQIVNSWHLPGILREVSGIAYLEERRIACIQDEDGRIFIYNLDRSKVEKEVRFAGEGDYEGIAVAGSVAYVVKSNGTVYKIANFRKEPRIREFRTWLTAEQDVEGICYDPENNRLLLAIKEKDPSGTVAKGIYAFDMDMMRLVKEPVFRINPQDEVFREVRRDNLEDTFKPSEVSIHPQTKELLLLDGRDPMLLIIGKGGEARELLILDEKDFPQPEGLTFDHAGNMYVSSEGRPGRIHQVNINRK